MSFFILTIVSTITWRMFFRIEKWWFAFIPLFFMILYSIDRFTQISFSNIWNILSTKAEYGSILSWFCIMIWITALAHAQHINRYYNWWFLVVLNTILAIISYQYHYKEWKVIFIRGLLGSRIIMALSWWYRYNYDNISMIIITIGFLETLWVCQSVIVVQWSRLSESDKIFLNYIKELSIYGLCYSICYRIFPHSYLSMIVLQMLCTTIFIWLRQQFLSYQSQLHHEKNTSLSARALLEWQKVLTRYENKKDSTYSFMNGILSRWFLPSQKWLALLQYIQWIQIIALIFITIRGLWQQEQHIIIRYRIGISCFIINIFLLDRQERFFEWYKKLGLILISSSFYITLFSSTHINSVFIISSLTWNCINMIWCLFYDTIIPLPKRILNRQDLLFRMFIINLTSIISIISLWSLAISNDSIVALWCIIIGIVSFFSYHIWTKYNIIIDK